MANPANPNPRPRFRPLRAAQDQFRTLRLPRPPFIAVSVAVISVTASWIPLAVIARAWFNRSGEPRIHLIQDMDNQPKFKPQHANLLFADMRADRPKIPGTVALGHLEADDHYNRGYSRTWNAGKNAFDVTFFDGFPKEITIDEAFLKHGQERFAVSCSPCHGLDGMGNGPINVRATGNNPKWVGPSNLLDADRTARPAGHIYNTITNGIRNMGGYGFNIPTRDRWAITAYVKTLQFAAHANPNMVPADQASNMPVPPPPAPEKKADGVGQPSTQSGTPSSPPAGQTPTGQTKTGQATTQPGAH